MKAGSVIVDLAGEAGGNCELTEPGQTVIRHQVKIVSPLNLPATMAEHASQLFARNVLALLELLIGEDGKLHARLRGRDRQRRLRRARRRDRQRRRPRRRGGRRVILASVLTTNLAILVLAGLHRLRRDLEGAEHAAHAADVRHQRDPRDRAARRPAADRPVRQRHLQQGDPGDRDRLRDDQRRSAASSSPTACSRCSRPSRSRSPRRARTGAGRGAAPDDACRWRPASCRAKASSTSSTSSPSRSSSRACAGSRGRRPRCAATASPPWAWRSRSSPRCSNPTRANWGLIALGIALGTAVGVPAARQVKMTAMPQMVALFNGVGGGAVFLISWAEFRRTGGFDGHRHLHHDLLAVRGDRRLGLLLGLEHRLRQAPGNHPRAPDHARRGASRRSTGCCSCSRSRRAIDIAAGDHSEADLHRHARVRGAARQRRRAADRRRRHAGRDLAAERLHRPLGGRHRDRAEQPRADRRGHDRRRLRARSSRT